MEIESEATEIGHQIGEDNIDVLGLNIHHPVFAISSLLAVAIVLATLVFQHQAAIVFEGLKSWVTGTFDWLFIISASSFFALPWLFPDWALCDWAAPGHGRLTHILSGWPCCLLPVLVSD